MTTLSKADKVQLIEARSKQLEYRKYGLELDLILENAKSTPDDKAVEVIEASIAEIEAQVLVLNSELTEVNSLPE
ncbi:hypothetical protein EB001_18005 [bacterium]|nr:hypothetical protein [Actinomycetota bacterium]NDB60326.1 hypothetical protein [bacterium]